MNNYQEHVPIGYAIVETENSKVVGELLWNLKKLATIEDPLTNTKRSAMDDVKIVSSDFSKVYNKAWQDRIGSRVKHLKCSWHFEKNLKLRVKSKNEKCYAAIRSLQLLSDKKDFWGLWQVFVSEYGQTEEGRYFIDQYGFNGLTSSPKEWSRAYNRNLCCHNLYPER